MREQKHNATCQTCGNSYHVCRSCEALKDMGVFNWKANCDTPECFQIFMIALDFKNGIIDAVEAKKRLSHINYEKHLQANTSVKRILDKLFDTEEVQIVECTKHAIDIGNDIVDCHDDVLNLEEDSVQVNLDVKQFVTKGKKHKKNSSMN